MKRWQSGLLLIGVGVTLNVLGRLVSGMVGEQTSLFLAGMVLFIAFCSAVIVLFGVFRLITGLITKS